MADNYIKNLYDNYVNFLLASNTITKLQPRRINQHENPHEKHNVPNQQFQIIIPPQIPHNLTSQRYPNPKSKKKRLKNSSLPQKTQSDDLKSNHSQKKLKNDLTTQEHTPYHTQKKNQKSKNYEKKKKKNPKPITLLVPTL